MPTPITLTCTGHRPDKLGGYNTVTEHRLAAVAKRALGTVFDNYTVIKVISGMALGWDLAVAQAALDLRIPLICALPCLNQPSPWPPKSIETWAKIKAQAAEVHIISPHYSDTAMQLRNIWMVDTADLILALYNGGRGGTKNCLTYAKEAGKPIINVWEDYKLETL